MVKKKSSNITWILITNEEEESYANKMCIGRVRLASWHNTAFSLVVQGQYFKQSWSLLLQIGLQDVPFLYLLWHPGPQVNSTNEDVQKAWHHFADALGPTFLSQSARHRSTWDRLQLNPTGESWLPVMNTFVKKCDKPFLWLSVTRPKDTLMNKIGNHWNLQDAEMWNMLSSKQLLTLYHRGNNGLWWQEYADCLKPASHLMFSFCRFFQLFWLFQVPNNPDNS